MAGLTEYKEIVKATLRQYQERYLSRSIQGDVETLLTFDDEHGIYLVLRTGWQAKERIQHILIYIRLVDGRVCVEEDWTDFDVVGRLLDAGVPQDDIVLAFHHPSLRPYADFAPV
jgi:hypothetical protein